MILFTFIVFISFSLSFFFSFFFSSYLHPRDLHSFPTRRSSDLQIPAREQVRERERVRPVISRHRSTLTSHIVTRSEEHTSELQSRLHLVCRLLLEKKKKKKKINHATDNIT